MKDDATTNPVTFEQVVEQYRAFLAERHWGKPEPKNFAVSISLEANELLEHYQWSDEPVGNREELADELADILLYAVQFADCYDINIPEAMVRKMIKAGKKYPAEEFASINPNEQRKAWLAAKKRHVKKESL